MTEINGYLVGPNANLMCAQLAGANLSNLDLRQINFQSANLKAADLRSSNLQGVVFGNTPCDQQGTDLRDANLAGVTLANAYMGYVRVDRANFDDAVFTGMRGNLPQAFWPNGTIAADAPSARRADFRNFTPCSYCYLGFGAINLAGARFGGVVATMGITFSGSNLSGAELANMVWDRAPDGATYSEGFLEGKNIVGIPASLPAGVQAVNQQLVGPKTRITGNLRSADLRGTNLSGARLEGGSLVNANLQGANLTNVLSGAGNGADLGGADLTGATLTGASLCSSGRAPSALPANWSVAGNCLVGPGALLGNALNLGSADLSTVDMDGAHSTGWTRWTGTGLPTGVIAVTTGSSYSDYWTFLGPTISNRGAFIPSGDLHGRDMRTMSADLHGANFQSYNSMIDLSQSTWGSANMACDTVPADTGTSVNFIAVKLAGASFSGVDMGAACSVSTSAGNSASDWTNVILTNSNLHLQFGGTNSAELNMSGARGDGSTWSPPTAGWPDGATIPLAVNLSNASLRGATFRKVSSDYNQNYPVRLDFSGADLTNASYVADRYPAAVSVDSIVSVTVSSVG
jgi:uncharacterized protein YjbI with pentapeptide repeats